MGGFWWAIGVIVVILWVVAVVDIVRKRHLRTGAKTAAWILLVIILGVLIYLFASGKLVYK